MCRSLSIPALPYFDDLTSS